MWIKVARAGVLDSGRMLRAEEGAHGVPNSHHLVQRGTYDPLPRGPMSYARLYEPAISSSVGCCVLRAVPMACPAAIIGSYAASVHAAQQALMHAPSPCHGQRPSLPAATCCPDERARRPSDPLARLDTLLNTKP